jgi:multidrug resistance efflux pump
MERGRGADNYMQFKNNIKYEKLEQMIDMADRCRVDIQSEKQDLNDWNTQYKRYDQMFKNNSLWSQGFEKLKTIQRNIFQSAFDQQKLYFEIERRLQIAEEIRQDIKQAYDQAQQADSRVKYSRVKASLRHFAKNCQITAIPEVEKLQK